MSDDLSRLPIKFGRGTTPRKVREAIEQATEHQRSRPPTTTSERERFFRQARELVERAGGEPR